MRVELKKINKPRICVLGGTGFVGRHLVTELANQGYSVRVLTRHRERHRDLFVLPGLEVIEANVHNEDDLKSQFAGMNIVINLVAILNEKSSGDFQKVHVDLAGKIIKACKANGITRLIHMSALNAHPQNGSSQYLQSKGMGEHLVHTSGGIEATSFSPSVIFGPDDHFFNRFASMLKMSPLFFPLACPEARFAPIFVGDVVYAICMAIKEKKTIGKHYNLCGPKEHSLKDLVQYTAKVLRIKRRIIPLSDGASRLQAKIMGHLPGKLFTYDNYLSMKKDCVCKGAFPSIFGITPASIFKIVPAYVGQRNQRARFHEYRSLVRHDY